MAAPHTAAQQHHHHLYHDGRARCGVAVRWSGSAHRAQHKRAAQAAAARGKIDRASEMMTRAARRQGREREREGGRAAREREMHAQQAGAHPVTPALHISLFLVSSFQLASCPRLLIVIS